MTREIGTTGSRHMEEGSAQEVSAPPVVSTDIEDGRGLVTISSSEYERIQAAAELYVFAERRGLRLVRADGPNGHLVSQVLVVDNVLLLPPGRHPRDVLRDVGAGSGASH
ncbi:hypothetical protein [Streptomyces sp. NBC_00091]|uniref:hypothetical protein n=1 Tax=Streptomyces sp. NBC_00091 TaxID=2975648 RepID=UPI002257184F|nr:hypothetical protein [Streptomyces sp. NBC_00091]MCX5380409.1 hypothetical protein [Streptomyces sp. NBC_00091]